MTSSSSLPGRGGLQWGPSCSTAHQSWPASWASWNCSTPRQAQRPQSWRCMKATAPRTPLRCSNVPETPSQSQRDCELDDVAKVNPASAAVGSSSLPPCLPISALLPCISSGPFQFHTCMASVIACLEKYTLISERGGGGRGALPLQHKANHNSSTPLQVNKTVGAQSCCFSQIAARRNKAGSR